MPTFDALLLPQRVNRHDSYAKLLDNIAVVISEHLIGSPMTTSASGESLAEI